ncbi:hypothetical protein CI109_106178 [Kwoniella shandongensis]|uniref:Uncharacterized protein n=1 Tax=Kwoniella shandongensis TaxID=1734106 RepID=A0AAJ8LPK3_9TREE
MAANRLSHPYPNSQTRSNDADPRLQTPSALLAARPGKESAEDLLTWFSGEDPETLAGVVGMMNLDDRGEDTIEDGDNLDIIQDPHTRRC